MWKSLVGAGADVEARNVPNSPHGDHNRTALHIAAWETHTQVCKVLYRLRLRHRHTHTHIHLCLFYEYRFVIGKHTLAHTQVCKVLLLLRADCICKHIYRGTRTHIQLCFVL